MEAPARGPIRAGPVSMACACGRWTTHRSSGPAAWQLMKGLAQLGSGRLGNHEGHIACCRTLGEMKSSYFAFALAECLGALALAGYTLG